MWGQGPYGGAWGGGWMFPFGGIFWLLLIVAAISVAVWWGRTAAHPTASPPSRNASSTALDILQQRYARGDIERDEYLQKRRDLLAGEDA